MKSRIYIEHVTSSREPSENCEENPSEGKEVKYRPNRSSTLSPVYSNRWSPPVLAELLLGVKYKIISP